MTIGYGLHCGCPTKRERVFIRGAHRSLLIDGKIPGAPTNFVSDDAMVNILRDPNLRRDPASSDLFRTRSDC